MYGVKRKRLWVLVADDGHARLLRDFVASEGKPKQSDILHEAENLRSHDITSDRPGRSFASVGARRSAMEPHTQPVREQDRLFAALLMQTLDDNLAAGDFDELIIIAAPQMLGDLRKAATPALSGVIVKEIAKDLTTLPTSQLYAKVAELAAFPGGS